MISSLPFAQRLKLEILEHGVEITDAARRSLTNNGHRRLVERDYATTGGLTLILDNEVYVNAPLGEWYCDHPAATLDVSPEGSFFLQSHEGRMAVNPLQLPDYLFRPEGAPHAIMTHADRVRISPLSGCACRCRFCDWHKIPYQPVGKETLLEGLRVSLADRALPPRHVLVSGGTPLSTDEPWLLDVYLGALGCSPLPVDVMLTPRQDRTVIERLVAAGVHGFSVNIELFGREAASRYCPEKFGFGLDLYEKTLRRAVELTGGNGRVRSLLLLGLEPPERTLEGVEFIASLGVDPVLSPFRPAPGTELVDRRPPSTEMMEDLYLGACEIVHRHGVKLGPRCIPCMHNTVTFPDPSGAYYYS